MFHDYSDYEVSAITYLLYDEGLGKGREVKGFHQLEDDLMDE